MADKTNGIQKLGLATIHMIDDGTLQAEFDRACNAAVAHCEDRPAQEQDRTVTVKFRFRPITSSGSHCTKVDIDAEVTSSLPALRTTPCEIAIKKGPKGIYGLFNPSSLDDVEQGTFDG